MIAFAYFFRFNSYKRLQKIWSTCITMILNFSEAWNFGYNKPSPHQYILPSRFFEKINVIWKVQFSFSMQMRLHTVRFDNNHKASMPAIHRHRQNTSTQVRNSCGSFTCIVPYTWQQRAQHLLHQSAALSRASWWHAKWVLISRHMEQSWCDQSNFQFLTYMQWHMHWPPSCYFGEI